MKNIIEIFQSDNNDSLVEVKLDNDTVWLNRNQIATLFNREVKTIGKHINNIFSEGELTKYSVVANFATTATDGKTYNVDHYNLDVIISVGYRVKSQNGTRFRIWATKILKDYLVEGYAVNKKRLEEKQQELELLKDGIRIISRAINIENENSNSKMLSLFSKGLELLDDYDHETLDDTGISSIHIVYPTFNNYMETINEMCCEFESDVFAKPKDNSFNSSITQIKQSINNQDIYPTLEEKAANLLYFVTKNHSFVDGNKRIAAACFLLFLNKNSSLYKKDNKTIISNDTLATLTLFIATSKPEESETVKMLIISILNRNMD